MSILTLNKLFRPRVRSRFCQCAVSSGQVQASSFGAPSRSRSIPKAAAPGAASNLPPPAISAVRKVPVLSCATWQALRPSLQSPAPNTLMSFCARNFLPRRRLPKMELASVIQRANRISVRGERSVDEHSPFTRKRQQFLTGLNIPELDSALVVAPCSQSRAI